MNTEELLAFIGKYESKNNPNAIWGGISKADYPSKPITQMTVGQVLAWQDSIDHKYMSEASGEWQFMEDTLRGLVGAGVVKTSAIFNKDTQVILATALLERRGLSKYLSGKITLETFANNIAKEWASMPVVSGKNRGRSYYAGDGLNKSHTPVEEYLEAVKSVRATKVAPTMRTPSAPRSVSVVDSTKVDGLLWTLFKSALSFLKGRTR